MSKQLRYRGEFVSRAGVVWRVDIMQDADQPFDSIGALTFEAEETLLMEWEEKSKEEVLQGCMVTLKVESPGDRTYEDLYTIEVGRIRMDVYRNNALYWCGTLDAEFYEEPYEKAAKYPVSLKFSDFGVLGRLKYDLAGMRTLKEIVTYCLQRAGLTADIDESLISTCISGSTPMSLKDLIGGYFAAIGIAHDTKVWQGVCVRPQRTLHQGPGKAHAMGWRQPDNGR